MTTAQTKVTPHHSNTQRSAQPIMPSSQKTSTDCLRDRLSVGEAGGRAAT
jgi:hypothetical protein